MKLKQNKKFKRERLLGWKTIEVMHIYPWALSNTKKGKEWGWAKYYVSCGALCKTEAGPMILAMADIENAIETGEYILAAGK